MITRLEGQLALKLVARRKAAIAEYEEAYRKARGNLTHCVHGTYIGTWAGPDYMCGLCESGVREDIYGDALREAKARWAKATKWTNAVHELYHDRVIDRDTYNKVMHRVFEEVGI